MKKTVTAASFVLAALIFVVSIFATAAPQSRTISGLICGGYGFYPAALGSTCPPPPPPPASEADGVIAFRDVISGPASGVGDGAGSGMIVTIWGWFGESQGSNTVVFRDSFNTERPAHVYYWKNADGTLPSGPANLYESHGLQEVAISIPAGSAAGDGHIVFKDGGGVEMDSADFRVRDGTIYHVKSTGSNSNNGSFNSPFLTVGHCVDNADVGGSCYVHDVNTGDGTTFRGVYKASGSPKSTMAAQFFMGPYPGFHPEIYGEQGVQGYQQEAMVVSKFKVFSSDHIEEANGQPSEDSPIVNSGSGGSWGIRGTAFGRIIGNVVTDSPGNCASHLQGAINSTAKYYDYTSDLIILGNEIYDYGCEGSDRLHHTVYLSIRSSVDLQVGPPEMGFNYLHENWAKNGLHIFDQDANCGDYTGDVHYHNNVVINQAGAGLYYGSSGCDRHETVHMYNNLLVNVGLPSWWDGINPASGSQMDGNGITIWASGYDGTVNIFNNTIIGWDRDNLENNSGCVGYRGSQDAALINFNSNICVAVWDRDYFAFGTPTAGQQNNIFGANNVLFYVGDSYTLPSFFADMESYQPWPYYTTNPATPLVAVTPTDVVNVTDHIEADPLLTFAGRQVAVGGGSSAIDVSNTSLLRDLYGSMRAAPFNAGVSE